MSNYSKIKWGIIGLGGIAHQFIKDLLLVPDAEIKAVASRSPEKAISFSEKYNVEKAYGSYQDIFEDEEIDIIYIATPHNSHAQLSIQALKNNKHVLCEKPVALNANETTQIITTSKKYGKFFMEAFWTRFNPSIEAVDKMVNEGLLGDIKYINADFAFYVENAVGSRMTDVTLGGGSLLEMGVYPIFLSYLILGNPDKILASSSFYQEGSDSQTSIILQYQNAQAVLHSSFVSPSNMEATISGNEGRINIHPVWHETQGYSLIKNNHKVDFHFPTKGKGFTYEIEECHKCLSKGKIESDKWSHQNSLNLIGIVDEVRKQIGLKFPSEK